MTSTLALCGCNTTTTTSPPTTAKTPIQGGCYSASYGASSTSALGCGPIQTFGDAGFDQRFVQEIQLQNQFWGKPTQVWGFNECDAGSANALSLPQGVILMGYWLTVKTIFESGTELPVAGIMAHEFAHQIQFLYGWMQSSAPTVRNTELEADAFAGIYMAIAKNWTGTQLASFVQAIYRIGDYNFTDRGHHGTPQERQAAALLGMQVGYQILQSGQFVSYPDIHAFFVSQLYGAGFTSASALESLKLLKQEDISLVQAVREGRQSVTAFAPPTYPASYRRTLFPGRPSTFRRHRET